MNERSKQAIERLIDYAVEFEDDSEYPRDEQGNVIRTGTILEEVDVALEYLKVSDVRKYHLVSLSPVANVVKFTTTDVTEMNKKAIEALHQPVPTVYDHLIIVVDPAGEIEIIPV